MLQNSVRSQNMVTCIKTKQNRTLLRYLYSVRSFSDTCRPLTPAICVSFQFFPTTYFIAMRKLGKITWKGQMVTSNSYFSEEPLKLLLTSFAILSAFLSSKTPTTIAELDWQRERKQREQEMSFYIGVICLTQVYHVACLPSVPKIGI